MKYLTKIANNYLAKHLMILSENIRARVTALAHGMRLPPFCSVGRSGSGGYKLVQRDRAHLD
jgi:hypothetical protein